MKPISPLEAVLKQANTFPDPVFAAFNDLIAENLNGGNYAKVMQKDAAVRIALLAGCSEKDVYANKWLNIEKAYELAGWDVRHHSPDYTESYEPHFIFRKKD